MANYDSQQFQDVIQQQGTAAPLSVEEVQAPVVTPEPQQVLSPIEKLRAKYALQDQAIQSVTPVPMAQVEPPVQVPFASVPDQRAVEMQQTQDQMDQRQADLEQLAAQSQLQTEQEFAVQTGQERAIASAEQKAAEKQHEIDSFTAAEMNKEDQDAERTMAETLRGDSLGKKIGLAISVLLGGYAQGLTGSQTNPVMNFLEKLDQQVLANRELKSKERAAVREHALKMLDQKLKEARARTDDQKTQLEMDKLRTETDKIRLDIENGRKVQKQNQLGAKILNPMELDAESRKSLVRLPDKSFVMSPLGEKAADRANKFMEEMGDVQNSVNDYVNFVTDNRWVNPVGKDKAIANQKADMLIGKLRLAITGPGPLTEPERKFIGEIIGNPTDIFSFYRNQKARVDELKKAVDNRVINNYKYAGIDIETPGMTQQDRLTDAGITPERRAQVENYIKLKRAAQTKGK